MSILVEAITKLFGIPRAPHPEPTCIRPHTFQAGAYLGQLVVVEGFPRNAADLQAFKLLKAESNHWSYRVSWVSVGASRILTILDPKPYR